MEALVFSASFAQVYFLGLNSKMLRDDMILAAAITSWLITLSQFFMVWSVTNAGLDSSVYILCAGLGGSMGITVSQYSYRYYEKKKRDR